MSKAIVIRGLFKGPTFEPDEPLPDIEGPAQLIILPEQRPSIFDVLGKAPVLRTTEDIEGQVREERDSWGER